MNQCPFCLPNNVIRGDILYEDNLWYFIKADDGELRNGAMIITKRHVLTPFEINKIEWGALYELLHKFKKYIDEHNPDGYNLGWNINEVAGQNVEHAHLHIFPRYSDEPLAGKGIRFAFKQKSNKRTSVNVI